ncbi:DUF222 domain-containing protein [Microbacterium sp.]|uniref:DUF222 domain-containing protein n=1 Tax=Microbacterium sp. TaxID=51671 RepID=UPI003C71FE22
MNRFRARLSSADVDPLEELWGGPDAVSDYLDALVADAAPMLDAVWDDDLDVVSSEADGLHVAGSLVQDMAEIEAAARRARAANAEQDVLFHRMLVRAAADPVPWVGPDPTVDPLWQPRKGETVHSVRKRRRDLAVRAAAADIGARVHLTDGQVRGRAHRVAVLTGRCPRVWEACVRGDVSEQNTTTMVELAGSLPGDDPASWGAFDDTIRVPATTLAPGRFRLRARAARERVHRESLEQRHRRAVEGRRVWVDPLPDGMAPVTSITGSGG